MNNSSKKIIKLDLTQFGSGYLNQKVIDDINTLPKGIKLTEEDYNELQEEDKTSFPFFCPDTDPIMCNLNSNHIGLCKRTIEQCNDERGNDVVPVIFANGSRSGSTGEKFGYHTNNLFDFCGNADLVTSETFDDYDVMTDIDNVKIMTYNIWGIIKKPKLTLPEAITTMEIMTVRMKKIAEIIKNEDPDIICFQEMTPEALAMLRANLSDLSDGKQYYEFNDNMFPDKTLLNYRDVRGRDLETYVMSKYKPKGVYQYTLSGNLGYPNDVMIVEFNNFIVVNCYLQAGSKHSAGQEDKWMHYSRCRIEELRALKNILDSDKFSGKKILMMGDFNFNISDSKESLSEWPENMIISEMNLRDAWNVLHPGEDGFTEDTDINNMRFNTKFLEKKFRYDGIFYKSDDDSLTPQTIKIIGTEPINVSAGLSERFIKYMSNPNRRDELQGIDRTTGRINIHPSDHFGLVAQFTF